MITQDLNARIAAASRHLGERGWTQGAELDDAGQVCLNGAIRYCAPQNGDEYLVRAVLRHQGYDEEWNDDPQRTEDEVRDFLGSFAVTDSDLEETFGPYWVEMVQIIRQAATLTPCQVQHIHDARHAILDNALNAPLDAALNAALDADRDDARYAAADTAWDAAEDAVGDLAEFAARYEARYAARYAAVATVTQDLISEEHHRALMGPWREAFPDA